MLSQEYPLAGMFYLDDQLRFCFAMIKAFYSPSNMQTRGTLTKNPCRQPSFWHRKNLQLLEPESSRKKGMMYLSQARFTASKVGAENYPQWIHWTLFPGEQAKPTLSGCPPSSTTPSFLVGSHALKTFPAASKPIFGRVVVSFEVVQHLSQMQNPKKGHKHQSLCNISGQWE